MLRLYRRHHRCLLGGTSHHVLHLTLEPLPPPKDTKVPVKTARPTHKRTLNPAPAAELQLVFRALRPAKSRVPVSGRIVLPSPEGARVPFVGDIDHSLSSRTFGSAPFHVRSLGASPVFKKASGHPRKQLSLVPVDPTQLHCDDADASVDASGRDSLNLPISADARRNLGLAGTLGGSLGAGELDASDPDSDIPDEL